jgi:hypothetical protein
LQTTGSHQPNSLIGTANLQLINLDRVYKPVSWSKGSRIRAHIRITRTCQARTAPTRPHTSGPLISVSFLNSRGQKGLSYITTKRRIKHDILIREKRIDIARTSSIERHNRQSPIPRHGGPGSDITGDASTWEEPDIHT